MRVRINFERDQTIVLPTNLVSMRWVFVYLKLQQGKASSNKTPARKSILK